jgi:hypothetical protein
MSTPNYNLPGNVSSDLIDSFNDLLGDMVVVNSTIPTNVTEICTSGSSNTSTVSSLFDIQYRSWTNPSNYIVNFVNKTFLGEDFRTLESLVTHDRIELVEGLIVDTKSGGVGYRNHTIPVDLEYGGT